MSDFGVHATSQNDRKDQPLEAKWGGSTVPYHTPHTAPQPASWGGWGGWSVNCIDLALDGV